MKRPDKPIGFFIKVACPGCGAEVELQEDFFSLACRYCGSILRIVMPDVPPAFIIEGRLKPSDIRFRIDRQLKEQNRPLTVSDFSTQLIYYPYWKIDAIRMRVQEKPVGKAAPADTDILTAQITYHGLFQFGRALGTALTTPPAGLSEKNIEVSLTPFHSTTTAGKNINGLPPSIGLRAEYIYLKPLTARDDDSAVYVPVTRAWTEVTADLKKTAFMCAGMYGEGRCHRNEILEPQGAIVYFPYYVSRTAVGPEVERFVSDGLTGRVLDADVEGEGLVDAPQFPSAEIEFGQIEVEFHRCRNCGRDLPARKSCLYICENCHQIVSLDNNRTIGQRILQADCAGKTIPSNTLYFPFWIFPPNPYVPKSSGKEAIGPDPLQSQAVPAFTLRNFDVMRRLSRRVSSLLANLALQPVEQYDHQMVPVTVGLAAAGRLASIVLYCAKAVNRPGLDPASFQVSMEEARLCYLPFCLRQYFYVDALTDAVTFEQSAFMPL